MAGASAGAMSACLIAVGLKSHQIEEFLNQDTRKILMGMPNIITRYNICIKWLLLLS